VAESAVYDCLVQQVMTCLVLTRLSRVDMGARRGQTLTAAETTINNNGDHSRPPTRLLIFAAAMFSASSVACPTCRAVRHRDRDNSQTIYGATPSYDMPSWSLFIFRNLFPNCVRNACMIERRSGQLGRMRRCCAADIAGCLTAACGLNYSPCSLQLGRLAVSSGQG